MANSKTLLIAGTALFALTLCCLSSSASAGFQWVPDPDRHQKEKPESLPTAPPPVVYEGEDLTDDVVSDGMVTLTPSPLPLEMQGTQDTPTQWNNPAPAKTDTGIAYPVLDGFGKDLPLVMGLQQVVPPQYAYKFASDVQPKGTVSWDGGKPWNTVLQEMINPLGLTADIQNKTVTLRHTETNAFQADYASENTSRRNAILDPGRGNMDYQQDTDITVTSKEIQTPILEPLDIDTDDTSYVMPQVEYINDAPVSDISPVPANTAADNYGSYRRTIDSVSASQLHPTQDDVYLNSRNFREEASMENSYQDDRSWIGSVSQKMANIASPFSSSKVNAKTQMWEAHKGDSLKDTLVQWSREANVNLVWNASRDYTVDSNVLVSGTFNTAIKSMMDQGLQAGNRPQLKLIDNPGNNQATTFIISDAS